MAHFADVVAAYAGPLGTDDAQGASGCAGSAKEESLACATGPRPAQRSG